MRAESRNGGQYANLLQMPKADGWATGAGVEEVIVVVGYGDGCVLGAVGIGVSDEGCLLMLSGRQL